MSESPSQIYIAFDRRRTTDGNDHPQHWILIVAPENSTKDCTFYHVKDSQEYSEPRKCEHLVETDKSLEDHTLETTEKVATIPAGADTVVGAIAGFVKPRRCQEYIIAVLEELEKNGTVPKGTAEQWAVKKEASLYDIVTADKRGGDTIFDLQLSAQFAHLGGLKDRKCCY
ncbi:hypothetical protein BJX99DRAFT_260935 [Aspergillus californicus]